MNDYQESTYGDRIADVYDELHANLGTPEQVAPMVDMLAELAGSGQALELGIGTGRIALPLAARGVEVHGIDSSGPWSKSCVKSPVVKQYPSPWTTSWNWTSGSDTP